MHISLAWIIHQLAICWETSLKKSQDFATALMMLNAISREFDQLLLHLWVGEKPLHNLFQMLIEKSPILDNLSGLVRVMDILKRSLNLLEAAVTLPILLNGLIPPTELFSSSIHNLELGVLSNPLSLMSVSESVLLHLPLLSSLNKPDPLNGFGDVDWSSFTWDRLSLYLETVLVKAKRKRRPSKHSETYLFHSNYLKLKACFPFSGSEDESVFRYLIGAGMKEGVLASDVNTQLGTIVQASEKSKELEQDSGQDTDSYFL